MTTVEYDVGATPVGDLRRWLAAPADGLIGLPEMRGEDLTYPGVAGETPLDRVLGVVYEEFTLRVSGLNTDGTTPADTVARFHQNMRDTRQLFWDLDAPLSLTKRIAYPGGTVTYGPADARCVGFTPREESADMAVVLIRLKVYNGWGGVL